ncbi:MAG: (Fe-S)-binding protein [Sphingomonadaceae bacterium]
MSERVFFEGLEAESTICAYCGYCRAVCPTYAGVGWESCSPRGRIHLTRMLLEGRPPSADQMVRLYQCTMCGHCTRVCSTHIDLRRFWLRARAETVARDLAPSGIAAASGNVAASGNIYGYPNEERAGWVEYMDDARPDLYQRDRAEVVYFVGCSSSFSPRVQRIAESFVRLLAAAQVDFTLLGEGEVCCGFPLMMAGMGDRAERVIDANVTRFLEKEAGTVVFTCPACRIMWMEEYAPRLPGVRMLHSTEFLLELAEAGRLPLPHGRNGSASGGPATRATSAESRAMPPSHAAAGGAEERVVTYHDPCDLARNGGVYDAPRRLLETLPGVRLVEVHEGRERGECCGGGGDLEMVDPLLAGRVAARRVAQLASTGAGTIVTACPQCVRTLAQGAEASASGVEVVDVVELLAGVCGH